MNKKYIFQTANLFFRIVQIQDDNFEMDDLKGDSFNPKVNSDILPEKLLKEEKQFEKSVDDNGVYGFILQRWNPSPDKGWESVESCWGFVGEYNPNEPEFNHDIVEEYKELIKDLQKEADKKV